MVALSLATERGDIARLDHLDGLYGVIGQKVGRQIAEGEAQASAAAPLGRPGKPDEVAQAVPFLACDDSSYVTGIELFVGGTAQI